MNGFDYDLKNELQYKYVDVELHNNLRYKTEFNLQNIRVVMECGYSERNLCRWIILTTTSGITLLPQTYLKFNRRCELNFEANMNNLNYYVTLRLKDGSKIIDEDYNYLNWSKDFNLCLVGCEYELIERLDHNHRILLVGN